jgi:hypothetical protein
MANQLRGRSGRVRGRGYNDAERLSAAVESVLGQTLRRVEVITADGTVNLADS